MPAFGIIPLQSQFKDKDWVLVRQKSVKTRDICNREFGQHFSDLRVPWWSFVCCLLAKHSTTDVQAASTGRILVTRTARLLKLSNY